MGLGLSRCSDFDFMEAVRWKSLLINENEWKAFVYGVSIDCCSAFSIDNCYECIIALFCTSCF